MISDETTYHFAALDLVVSSTVLGVTIDEFIAESLMIPLAMIVLCVLLLRVPQAAFTHRDHLRQGFGLERTNESLGIRIQIGASRRELEGPDSRARQGDLEGLGEERMSIANQESLDPEEPAFGNGEIPGQPSCPLAIQRWRWAGDEDRSGPRIDHERHEMSNPSTPSDDFDTEEIRRRDGSPVSLEECPPSGSPQRCGIYSVLEEHSFDRVSRDLESKIMEGPLDPGVAPPGIVSGHDEDPLLELRRFSWPTLTPLLAAVILFGDELPVPAKQSIGRDERADFDGLATTRPLGSLCEATPVNLGEPQAFPAHLLSKGSTLFLEGVDHLLLSSIPSRPESTRELEEEERSQAQARATRTPESSANSMLIAGSNSPELRSTDLD